MIKIVLIEDHHLVREGIKALLEKLDGISVAGEAPDGKEGLDLVRKIKPDLVIMDINLPKINGINATKTIRNEFPEIKVIVLSMYSDDGIVRQAFAAGARGYLLKNSLGAELSLAIQSVMNNKVYFSPEIASVFLNDDPSLVDPTIKEDLTIREMEILQLIAEGNTNNQIASQLNLSPKTIENHRSNLMSKLDLHDVASVVKYAIRNKIIFLDD